jgi:polysaccharide export outer membrane protein
MRNLLAISILLISFSGACLAQSEEYVLKPGDVISISVVEHAEFSGRQKIRPDGKINYPVIGEVEVASLTCAQLVKIMQGKLATYINNPVVSVSIEAYYANSIYVIGGGKAGQYQIYEPLDVMKALAMCGGLSNQKQEFIKIIRADGTIVRIDMRGFWGNDTRRDPKKYVLYPGDTLYIPPTFTIPWGLIATILGIVSASLSIYLTVDRITSK